MSFGDILEKWENDLNKRNSVRKLNSDEDFNDYLNRPDIYDKDADIMENEIPGEKRRRLMRVKADDMIDIHGLTVEQAWAALDQFFSKSKDNGYEKLHIIHGKGNHSGGDPLLGKVVRDFIEQCVFAGESGHEKSKKGGSGVTWVFLKC